MKWQVINVLGRMMLSFVVFAVLARLLDPASFGLMSMTAVYVSFVALFAEQGLGTALIQRRELEPEHADTAFWFNLGTASTLCIGTLLFAGPVSRFLGEPNLAPLLRWSSLGLIVGASASIHMCLFVKEMDFRRPATRTLIANLSGGSVGVVLAFSGFGVWALVAQQLAATAAGAAFLWTASPYRPSLRFSGRHLRELLGVSSSVFGTSLLWFASSRLDQLIIGRFAGPAALGMYVIAGKLPEIAKTFTHHPVAEVSLPALAKIQGDFPRMQNAIYRGMEINATISFAVFLGLAAIAPQLVPTIFGAKWAAASDLCALLSLYALVNALQVFFHPALLASGGAGKYLLLNVWHSVGVLASCAIGIQFGTNYLVWGMITNGIIVAVGALILLRRRIGLSPFQYLTPCIAPGFAAALMFLAVRGANAFIAADIGGLPRIGCSILGGGSIYLITLFILAPHSVRNFASMTASILRKVQKPSLGMPRSQ